jgi:hypothetical protein
MQSKNFLINVELRFYKPFLNQHLLPQRPLRLMFCVFALKVC